MNNESSKLGRCGPLAELHRKLSAAPLGDICTSEKNVTEIVRAVTLYRSNETSTITF